MNNVNVTDALTSDVTIRFSAMSVKTWTWPKSITKKRYGTTNIHSMWGKLIQVTTPCCFAALHAIKGNGDPQRDLKK